MEVRDGTQIAVVGAGPAGSFFAYFLMRYAKEVGVRPRVTLFESKQFGDPGPSGCNMCAGVIAESFADRMAEDGLPLPESLVQSRVSGYRLVADAGAVVLDRNEPGAGVLTVFRGGGPRGSTGRTPASFDASLVQKATEAGAQFVPEAVTAIEWTAGRGSKLRVRYGLRGVKGELEADAAVGASGLEQRGARLFERLGYGYVPPRAVRSCQAELALPSSDGVSGPTAEAVLGGRIHIFLLGWRDLIFGALTPKRNYITVTLVRRASATLGDIREFLALKPVRSCLPDGVGVSQIVCHCRPSIAVSAARQPFTDRIVTIGDASVSRLYKSGIQSAFTTAQRAAEVMARHGLSRAALARHYYRPCVRAIARDNQYGRGLFWLNHFITRHPRVAGVHVDLLSGGGRPRERELLAGALWDTFVGGETYWSILARTLDVRLQIALAACSARRLCRRITRRWRQPVSRPVDAAADPPEQTGPAVPEESEGEGPSEAPEVEPARD